MLSTLYKSSQIPLRSLSRYHRSAARMSDNKGEEKQFGILPHPAKTNNPADLNSEPQENGGLQSASANAYNARGPHIPDQKVAEGLEQPKSRDELKAASAELNK